MAARQRLGEQLRTPLGAAAVVAVGTLLTVALVGPWLWGDDATATDTSHLLQGPSASHWAGTDGTGRDVLARVLVATRLSVSLALVATAIASGLGLLLGTVPAVLGRRAGRAGGALISVALGFPSLLLALFLATIFGTGARGAVLAIGVANAPVFARVCQTLVAGVESRDYVAAARIAGIGRGRIVIRHILPNIAEPLVVVTTIGAASALLSFAGLSFLGLGVQAPSYDWGRLLGEGLTRIYIHPSAALAPGVAVVLAGLTFNMAGEVVARLFGVDAVLQTPRSSPFPGLRARAARPPREPDRADPGDDATDDDAVLVARGLTVSIPVGGDEVVTPVRDVSVTIGRGEALGVVGESGAGKSLLALALAGLVEQPVQVTAASLSVLGLDPRHPTAEGRARLGTATAFVFQDPMTSFNPTRRIGIQLAEGIIEHEGASRRDALDRAVDRLGSVHVSEPERRIHQFPHELSGGMRQRAMIGMGLMGNPALVVADEPTTALDVTVQARVLELLAEVRAVFGVSLLLISHDVAVVSSTCDRVLVMYAGRVVEDLPADALATDAHHPYTRALVAAVPDMDSPLDRPLAVIPGEPVQLGALPAGCAFAPRCDRADDLCHVEDPPLTGTGARQVACWHPAGHTDADHASASDHASHAADHAIASGSDHGDHASHAADHAIASASARDHGDGDGDGDASDGSSRSIRGGDRSGTGGSAAVVVDSGGEAS